MNDIARLTIGKICVFEGPSFFFVCLPLSCLHFLVHINLPRQGLFTDMLLSQKILLEGM